MENGIRPPIQMAVDSMRNLCLGYTGEANAQLIQIDVSKWQEKWPGASIDLMLALPGEKASYPAKTELQDGKLLFLPGYGDTQKPGHGAAYVVATVGGTHVAVSETVITEILPRGRGGDTAEEAPEAQAGWVAHVLDAAHRAEEAARRAENAQVTDEQVGKAVEDYLTENPVEFEEKDPTVPDWAKAKEKPAYTAEEVGAQPKGNYALKSEIPAPYELPVASADTLGGVKVGDGLQMDGEKLGVVPEGNFELIETIVLEEETAKIIRNKKPSGEDYNFSELVISVVDAPYDSPNGNNAWRLTLNNDETFYTDLPIPQSVYKAYAAYSIQIRKGRVFIQRGASLSYEGLTNVSFNTPSTACGARSAKRITKIDIQIYGKNMRTGTKIEIFGAR